MLRIFDKGWSCMANCLAVMLNLVNTTSKVYVPAVKFRFCSIVRLNGLLV